MTQKTDLLKEQLSIGHTAEFAQSPEVSAPPTEVQATNQLYPDCDIQDIEINRLFPLVNLRG